MNRKELSAVVAECAVRSERAAAIQQEARAEQQRAVARQEAATARLEEIQVDAEERNKRMDAILAKQDTMLEEMRADRARWEADREDEKVWREEYLRRQEKMLQDFLGRADQVIVDIHEQREDLRAMKEAILKLIDRLPPPPPHLRSA